MPRRPYEIHGRSHAAFPRFPVVALPLRDPTRTPSRRHALPDQRRVGVRPRDLSGLQPGVKGESYSSTSATDVVLVSVVMPPVITFAPGDGTLTYGTLEN